MSKVIIDPPSGWMYGFPAALPQDVLIEDSLRAKGYPEKDIEFAICNLRVWKEEETEDAG